MHCSSKVDLHVETVYISLPLVLFSGVRKGINYACVWSKFIPSDEWMKNILAKNYLFYIKTTAKYFNFILIETYYKNLIHRPSSNLMLKNYGKVKI